MTRRKSSYAVHVTFIDHKGKEHFAPDPPEVNGLPPWIWQPNEYRRTEHLKKCPSLTCRKAQACRSPHYDGFCQKTHYSADQWRLRLCKRIDEVTKVILANPEKYPPQPSRKSSFTDHNGKTHVIDYHLRDLKASFEKRMYEGWAELEREYQQKWVDEQKEKERKMLAERAEREARKGKRRRKNPH